MSILFAVFTDLVHRALLADEDEVAVHAPVHPDDADAPAAVEEERRRLHALHDLAAARDLPDRDDGIA